VASALVRGRVDLSSFTDECVADPRIAELTGRVRVEADDRVRHDPEYATHLEIRLKDGRRVETFVPLALGKPSRWLSKAVLRAKFEDCVRHSGARMQWLSRTPCSKRPRASILMSPPPCWMKWPARPGRDAISPCRPRPGRERARI
jgi:2-methylcitrate dehydratase PrpD